MITPDSKERQTFEGALLFSSDGRGQGSRLEDWEVVLSRHFNPLPCNSDIYVDDDWEREIAPFLSPAAMSPADPGGSRSNPPARIRGLRALTRWTTGKRATGSNSRSEPSSPSPSSAATATIPQCRHISQSAGTASLWRSPRTTRSYRPVFIHCSLFAYARIASHTICVVCPSEKSGTHFLPCGCSTAARAEFPPIGFRLLPAPSACKLPRLASVPGALIKGPSPEGTALRKKNLPWHCYCRYLSTLDLSIISPGMRTSFK